MLFCLVIDYEIECLVSKIAAGEQSPSGSPAVFMFKYYGSIPYKFQCCRTNRTENDLSLLWPLWGLFEIPKLVYLQAQLENEKKTKQPGAGGTFKLVFGASQKLNNSKLAPYKK